MHQGGDWALWTRGEDGRLRTASVAWRVGGAELSQEEKKSDRVPGLVLVSWGVQTGTSVRNYDRRIPSTEFTWTPPDGPCCCGGLSLGGTGDSFILRPGTGFRRVHLNL